MTGADSAALMASFFTVEIVLSGVSLADATVAIVPAVEMETPQHKIARFKLQLSSMIQSSPHTMLT
ncbi:MAG: hypothetical protein Fur0025_25240 [Oscillatoriaceae cyanobacterium]